MFLPLIRVFIKTNKCREHVFYLNFISWRPNISKVHRPTSFILSCFARNKPRLYFFFLHIRNGEAHLPLLGFWSRRWICHRVCDTRPVKCQTYWHLPSLAALSCAQNTNVQSVLYLFSFMFHGFSCEFPEICKYYLYAYF